MDCYKISNSQTKSGEGISKGVLVAISIPIFTSQLEKSREATDASNIRAAYAELMADVLTGDNTDMTKYNVTLKQQTEDWQTAFDFPAEIGAGSTKPNKGTVVTWTLDANNKPSVNITLKRPA